MLLINSKTKAQDLNENHVRRTMRSLKCAFIASFLIVVFLLVVRTGMHQWTNHLEQESTTYNKKKVQYYCSSYSNNTNSAICVLIQIDGYLLFSYLMAVLLQFLVTYFFIMKLACFPAKPEKIQEEEQEIG